MVGPSHVPLAIVESSNGSVILPTLGVVGISQVGALVGLRWCLAVLLSCVFLMCDGPEHLFMGSGSSSVLFFFFF